MMKQYRSRLPVFLAPLLALAISSPAFAGFAISKGDIVQLDRTNKTKGGKYGGGEFQILHDGKALDFFTFCLEVKEHTQLNTNFKVGGINDVSFFGSNETSGEGGVPLALETRFLFNAYARGVLEDVSELGFAYNNDGSANALQRVIWHFQDQPDWLNWKSHSDANSLDQALIDYATESVNDAVPNENYGVFAMNLFDDREYGDDLSNFSPYDDTTWDDVFAYRAQDMLIYDPSAPPPQVAVPEPATVTVWLVAMLGLVVAARRRMLPAETLIASE